MSPADIERHALLIQAVYTLLKAKPDDWRVLNGALFSELTTKEIHYLAQGIDYVCGLRLVPPSK